MTSGTQQRGFTLIEVLVAVAVLAMVSLSIWTATSQTSRTAQIVDASHERLHQVRLAFDMISRDLSSSYLSMHRGQVDPSHNAVFIGQNQGDEDRVDFYSFSHQRRYLDVNESDQCEVGYFIDVDQEDSEIRNLIRREDPSPDLEPLEGGQYLVLVEDVVSFDMEYFDLPMDEWQEDWDTTEATGEGAFLPHQVRVRLVVHDRRGNEVVYGTQLAVPMRTPIWRKPFIPGMAPVVNK